MRERGENELPLGDAPPGVEAPDGKIRRLGGEFNVGRPPTIEPGDEQLIALAINMDGLQFERADRYEFVLELDGTEVSSSAFGFQIPQVAPIVR